MVNGNVVPKHRAVKTYGEIALRILNPCTRWTWVVSFTLRPHYPRV